MMAYKVLFIGLVWPEPTSSAAGTRILQLVNLFRAKGDEVHFCSAAQTSDFSFNLKSLGVSAHQTLLNSASFDDLVAHINPDIVVFDRFVSEEQFGWRVRENCPQALLLLDTEDLHLLRYARQEAVKTGKPIALKNAIALREIASILRCDLSLMISKQEIEILQAEFNIMPQLLYYLPFLEEPVTTADQQHWPSFEEREGFCFIGNFIHEPNWQATLVLKNQVWPTLSKLLPQASMNIYGAYASQKVLQLQNKRDRFFVHGRAEDAKSAIKKHRILLAPITFGAGAKGKLIDAMACGTPTATTTIGAESMQNQLPWAGIINNDLNALATEAAHLYQNKNLWTEAQINGFNIINTMYAKTLFIANFYKHITLLHQVLEAHRNQNFLGKILQQQSANSTKYMSLWIEEKNKKPKTN